MKLFSEYIKEKLKSILILLLFSVIFIASFILYRLPIAPVLYPTALCLFFGIIFLITDFIKYKKKHDSLEKIKKLTSAMIDELPDTDSITEKDYQEIIFLLKSENSHAENKSSERFRSMTEYYSVWAHQIKTPIASMKLSLQSEDTPLSRRLNSDLFRIEQYVEMVLAYLRLDSTATDYVFREYDIDTLIKQSVKKFASDFIGKKIRLEYEPLSRNIVTDEKWFAFVVEQILSNALKYTREGSVKIFIDSENNLCISDTGIGIAPEDLPRIFEKGYTGFNGRVDRSASGIGLYLCKRVCDNLGIKITAESTLNKGTVIKLNLNQHKVNKTD